MKTNQNFFEERITDEQFETLKTKGLRGELEAANPVDATKVTFEKAIFESEKHLRAKEEQLDELLNSLTSIHNAIKKEKVKQDTLIKDYKKNFPEAK